MSSSPKKAKGKGPSAKTGKETGMLSMEALSEPEGEDEDVDSVDGKPAKSATQFFAIPAKGKKPKEVGDSGAPPSRALPGQSAPVGIAALPGGGPSGMIGGPTQGGMGGAIGGPIAAGPIASGPMAGGGGMTNAGTPFAVAGGAQIGDVPPEERGSSARIFVVLLLIFGMFFAAMVVAVLGIGAVAYFGNQKTEVSAEDEPDDKPSSRSFERDDEPEEKEVDPVITEKPKPKPKPKPAGETTAAPAEKPKPKAAANAPLTVSMPASEPYRNIVVRCAGSGFSQKKPLSGGSGTIDGVPTGEDCELQFTDPVTARYRPVRGGQTLKCTFTGTTASCKQ